MVCLSCGSENLVSVLTMQNAPGNIQRLLKKEELESDKTTDIHLVQCNDCSLVQLDEKDFLKDEYYKDYVMTTSFLEKDKKYNIWLANLLVEKFDFKGKKVMDVGCGDGYFVEDMINSGISACGIEPSKSFYDLAKKRNIPVINSYLDENSSLERNSFDGFVSRYVFEHLFDPSKLLKDLHLFLKPGAVGMIEVPSFEKAMRDKRYYDIFRDHVAYYTKDSLRELVTRNGYDCLEVIDAFDFEYLIIFFQKRYDVQNFADSFEENKKQFKETINKLNQDNKKIIIWGAGGKGNAMLSLYRITKEDVPLVVDSDPNKIGRYTVGSHISIESPDYLKDNEVDVVIISAMAYQDEIIRILKEKYDFKGDIYVISPKLERIK